MLNFLALFVNCIDCVRERRSCERRETRAAALSHLASSVTRVAICVSRVLLDGLQKKERLLVVYELYFA